MKDFADRLKVFEICIRPAHVWKKLSDEKIRREVEQLKTTKIPSRVRHHSTVIPFERNTE